MGRKRKRGCEASRKRLRFSPSFGTKNYLFRRVTTRCDITEWLSSWTHLHCTLIISLFSQLSVFVSFTLRGFLLARAHTRPCDQKGHLYTRVRTHSHAQHSRTQQTHADLRIRLTGWLAGSGGSDSAHVDYSTAWRFNQALTDVAVCDWYDNQCYSGNNTTVVEKPILNISVLKTRLYFFSPPVGGPRGISDYFSVSSL